jgi:hypothetical protein
MIYQELRGRGRLYSSFSYQLKEFDLLWINLLYKRASSASFLSSVN